MQVKELMEILSRLNPESECLVDGKKIVKVRYDIELLPSKSIVYLKFDAPVRN